jgi:ankyrin repeat protein
MTALHHACNIGRFRTVKLLLEKGADPNAKSQSKHVPLSTVLMGGKRKDLAMLLLEHGANPNGDLKCSEPPIVVAAGDNDLEMVNELLARGADPSRPGSDVALAATTSVECAQSLLQHGAHVDLRNLELRTPLLQNINRASLELLKSYLDAGADVNAKDKYGLSALMRLHDNPRIDVAELLIAGGADVNACGGTKATVLDYLYSSTSHYDIQERVDLIVFLEGKGAKRAGQL